MLVPALPCCSLLAGRVYTGAVVDEFFDTASPEVRRQRRDDAGLLDTLASPRSTPRPGVPYGEGPVRGISFEGMLFARASQLLVSCSCRCLWGRYIAVLSDSQR